MVLKYCGENGTNLPAKITSAICFSVPTNLEAGSKNISKRTNYIYQKKFLDSLFDKLKKKHQQYPTAIDLSLIERTKTLYDFDDNYTGPLHGYKDAHDYYTRCSCEQFIPNITIPTLLINALDDPFLPTACYPHATVEKNKLVEFLTPRHGGHVGFASRKDRYYWSERLTVLFLNQKSALH